MESATEYDRIEALAASRALREAIGDALATLTAAERDVLRLRVVEERPYREVALQLGITEQTARAHAMLGPGPGPGPDASTAGAF